MGNDRPPTTRDANACTGECWEEKGNKIILKFLLIGEQMAELYAKLCGHFLASRVGFRVLGEWDRVWRIGIRVFIFLIILHSDDGGEHLDRFAQPRISHSP